MSMCEGLRGKAAIVTGAGRGIGEAIARSLACTGVKVLVADISGDEKAVAESIGGDARAQTVDILVNNDRNRRHLRHGRGLFDRKNSTRRSRSIPAAPSIGFERVSEASARARELLAHHESRLAVVAGCVAQGSSSPIRGRAKDVLVPARSNRRRTGALPWDGRWA
jgi:NAD(P)-dependent dehydrogenase (short-subunit alcohol dehydrogenase family)